MTSTICFLVTHFGGPFSGGKSSAIGKTQTAHAAPRRGGLRGFMPTGFPSQREPGIGIFLKRHPMLGANKTSSNKHNGCQRHPKFLRYFMGSSGVAEMCVCVCAISCCCSALLLSENKCPGKRTFAYVFYCLVRRN